MGKGKRLGKGGRRRKQEAKRRFGGAQGAPDPAQTAAKRDAITRALMNPALFAQATSAFGMIAVTHPLLVKVRYPTEPFLSLYLAAQEGPEEPVGARKEAAMKAATQELASPALAKQCMEAIESCIGKVEEKLLVPLVAANLLAGDCVRDPRKDHPFWELLFQVSITESLVNGALWTALRIGSLKPEREAITLAFGQALNGEAGAKLDTLGVSEVEPAKLVESYLELLELEHSYHLQFDGTLHLSLAHQRVAMGAGKQIAAAGLTEALRARLLKSFEDAYERDIEGSIVDELGNWFHGRLEQLRDSPHEGGPCLGGVEGERARCSAVWLSLRALKPEENPLLRLIHTQSLVLGRTQTSKEEQPFAAAVWGNPRDAYALEQYERFLREGGDSKRARRLGAFRTWLKEHSAELDAEMKADTVAATAAAQAVAEHAALVRQAAEGPGAEGPAAEEPAAEEAAE